MAVERVEYEVSLRDLLSSRINDADTAAKRLNGTMGNIKSMLGVLGVGFAVFKGVEFIKGSVEAYHHLEQATAQVKAGLESTNNAAGMSFEDVEKSAKSLSATIPYGRTQLLEMQSVLLTFPAVTKDAFTPASAIIADMSTRLGTDLKGSAIQVGKALQDPIKGVTALRRVGVNFSEAQTEMIKKMVEGGKTADAQKLILQELQTEFGGSAKAAADADPMFKFNKTMGSFKMAVGEAGTELLITLQPALEAVAGLFKSAGVGLKTFVEFLREHSEVVKAVGVAVGVLVAGLIVYNGVMKAKAILDVISIAYTNAQALASAIYGTAAEASAGKVGLVTLAQWAWNAALTANPIGIVVVAIGALIAGVVYAYESFGKFRGIIWACWGVIKEFASIVIDVYSGIGKTIAGVFTFNPKLIAEGSAQAINAVKDSATRIGKAAKEGYDAGMADFNKDQKAKAEDKGKKTAKAGAPPAAIVGDEKTKKDTSPKGASGTKAVTINITIGKLIEQFKITTTNLHESTSKVQEMVANTLLQAVNDSSIQAGI